MRSKDRLNLPAVARALAAFTAATTGTEPDPDGYTVSLGTASAAIGVNETPTAKGTSAQVGGRW
jgi:hypothetical protein